ncbi:hypothetical protein CRG98_014835 [Punica granatum]|uniref:Uncharacterized protein n=1 Tax=Punica granatum TaxID=22663 RepID=A0A2I0KAI9_PUNGR|nr:hypothetical protein CRG98_014835 [Punica granatum]
MEAFNHISGNTDKIYKQLTKSNTHPLGGTAYLNLENEDYPFLHGIKYTAMPPTKHFRDMEQLGVVRRRLLPSHYSSPSIVIGHPRSLYWTKSMLRWTIRMLQKWLSSYARNHVREIALPGTDWGSGFQSIVISLKDRSYDKAYPLVGVYRDSERT